MTNTQHAELVAELRAIRALLERAELRAMPSFSGVEVRLSGEPLVDLGTESTSVHDSPRDAFGPQDPTTGDPMPVFRGKRRGRK